MTHPHAAKLEEIEARLNAATRAPWRTDGWVPTWAYIPVKDARHNTVCSMYPDAGHNYTHAEVAANATLIANAPTNIRFLLDVARQAITIADGRDAVLEEAARVVEDIARECGRFSGAETREERFEDYHAEAKLTACAKAIRALQGKPIIRKEMTEAEVDAGATELVAHGEFSHRGSAENLRLARIAFVESVRAANRSKP